MAMHWDFAFWIRQSGLFLILELLLLKKPLVDGCHVLSDRSAFRLHNLYYLSDSFLKFLGASRSS